MRRARVVIAGLLIVGCSASILATVTVPKDFRQVVQDATLIVRGRVTDVRAAVVTDKRVDSFATIAVESTLKGEPAQFVSVRVPGGRIGRYRYVMVGAPTLRANERAVFFLVRDSDGAWRPVGLSSGIVAVGDLTPGGRAVVRPPVVAGRTASVGPVIRGDVRRGPMPIEEFESLVRLIVAGRLAGARPGR